MLLGEPQAGDPDGASAEHETAQLEAGFLRVVAAVSPGTRATVRVVDGFDRVLALATGVLAPTREVELVEGRSPRLQVACTAVDVVLFEDGDEVRRVAVTVEPDELLVLHL